MTPPTRPELRLLGAASLRGGSLETRLQRRVAGLLAYLALEGPTPRSRVAGLLWPDSPEAAARNNLRQSLKRLRESTGLELALGDETLSLAPGLEVDAVRLSTLSFQGERAQVARFEGRLLEALDYDDCPEFEEWLLSTREELDYLRRQAASEEAVRREDAGDLAGALEFARRALKLDPLSEASHRQTMRLHYLLGDRGAALAAYERLEEVLGREFGTPPLPETQALRREIERGGQVAGAHPPPKPRIPLSVLRPPALVGRAAEWAAMEAAWQAGQVIYVVGEPGSGKTRLVQDFVASKGRGLYLPARPGQGEIPFATAASLARLRLEAAPGVRLPQWVRRELSRILPELQEGEALPPLRGEEERLRFFQAYLEMVRLTGAEFVASVSDDVQYYDPATVELGAFMMAQRLPPGQRIPPYIVIYRQGEMSEASQAAVNRLVWAGAAARIDLGPLDERAVGELLLELALPGVEDLGHSLSHFTGGNPLFVLETLKHLIETGQLERGWPGRLPPPGRVEAVIVSRLEKLPPPALSLARAAAVLGEHLTPERAAAVLGQTPLELAPAFAQLESAQILRGNAFSHDLLYETMLKTLPEPIRGYLHRQAAGVLEGVAHPATLAAHWQEGGEPLRAAPYLLQASEEADFASRLAEGLALAERAAAIYRDHRDPHGEFEALWQVGRIVQGQGRFEALGAHIERMLSLASTPRQQARTLNLRAMFLLRTGRYSEALEQARAGFGWASRAGDLYTQAELEQIEAQAGLKLGRAAEAGAALERFRLLAERLEYPEAVLAATLDQGQLAALLDRHEEAIRLYREAEAGVRRWGQMQYALARIHNLIALSQLRLGLPQEALGSLESAKAVAARLEVPAPVRAQTRALEGAALALLGELGRALELLEDLPPAADLAPARAVQALLYRGLGQPDRAEQVLRAALASPELEALSRGLLLTQLGSIHGSPGLLGEAERLVQGGPGRLAQAQLWLAQAQQAEPSEGLTLGRRALGVAESLGLRSLEAQAHLWIAGALLAQGHPAEARPHSARAAELAENQALLRPEALLTHFRVLDRLGDPAAAAVLEAARTWLLETAEARVPPQHRPGFLDHPVHRALLAEAQRPQRT